MKDMLGRDEVVTAEEALNIFFRHFEPFPLGIEEVPIEESFQRILAEDMISGVDLPEFPRSTVDGYAVKAEDTFGATEALPVYLNLKGEILMGEAPEVKLEKGEVVKISTGGMLPPGSDSVVMFEHSNQTDERMIEVVKAIAHGENVIQIGEDVKSGERILPKGQRIRPQDMGALAGIGIAMIRVYLKPKVAIISTGDEVVEVDKTPRAGQIRDTNSYNLSGLVRLNGGIPLRKGVFPDEYERIYSVVKDSLDEADLVIISGGSSVGTRDMTEKVINDLGRPGVLVHGVSLKPGKPMIIGIVNKKPVFGLPGHPAAVSVCFDLFVAPIMRTISGEVNPLDIASHRLVRAIITRNIASAPGREDHIRVAIEEKDGKLFARPILGKSGLITTLVKASGIVVIPPTKLGLEAGEEVTVRLFD
jgi:molybdopterin molybdotransferase